MPNIIDILARALSLRQETALNSITPNRAGGIMYDTLLVLNQMQLEGGSLLISKVYASVSAMEADTTPTSDLTGRALKPGQLVVIVTSDSSSSDMGSEYRYNGPGSWTYVGKVGGLPLDTVPTQSSTKGITSGGVYTALAAMKAEGYKYMGLATPGSGGTAPGTPNQPVFYIAGPGSYPNFGSITVASGYLGFIKYSGGSWTVESVAVGKDYDEEISQLQHKVDGLEFKDINVGKLTPTIVANEYVHNGTGAFVPYDGWSRTGYINVRPFSKVKITATHASVYCAKYDANFQKTNGVAIVNGSIVIDVLENEYYLAVSDSTQYITAIQFEIVEYRVDVVNNSVNAIDKKLNAYAILEYINAIYCTPVSGGVSFRVEGGVYLYCRDNQNGYYTLDRIESRTIDNNHIIAYNTSDRSIGDFTKMPDQKTNIVLAVISNSDIVGGVLLPFWQRKKMQSVGDLADLKTEQKSTIVSAINELNAKVSDDGSVTFEIVKNSYVTTSGAISSYTGWDRTTYIDVSTFKKVRIVIQSAAVNYIYNYWYDANKAPLSSLTLTGTDAKYEVPSGAKYLVISNTSTAMATLEVTAEGKAPLDEDNILSLNPRSIYDGQIIQMSGKYGNGRISGILPPVVLAWFSDIHGDGVNLARLNEFCERYKTRISDILSSGDNVPSHYEDSYTFWANNGGGPVITALGNHDAWTDDNDPEIVEGGYQGETLFLVKPKLCYDKFFAPYISGWGVTQPQDAAAAGKCYFYKDYTFTQNGTTTTILRMIVLDCMHYNIYSDLVDGESVQNAWLVSTLADARTNGIPVLMVSHYKGDNISYLDCPWPSRDYSSEDITPLAKTAVKDFLDAGGELVCWLNGHDHFDIIGTFLSDPRQLQIGIETAKCPDTWGDSERVSGTKTQDCFNLLAVDTRDKLIKIVRVGDDYNRGLYHKGRLVYRYKAVDESHPQGLVLCE